MRPARPIAITLTLAAAATAAAQPAPSTQLERVEPGFEDVSPLARSLQEHDVQLRQPAGFDAVYRVPNSNLYMRQNGAIHAVFPRSTYQNTPRGQQATIPPGTIYSIGEPSEELLRMFDAGATPHPQTRHPQQRRSPLLLSARLDASATGDPQTANPRARQSRQGVIASGPWSHREIDGGADTLWRDDRYRQRRVADLMADAASR